MNIKRTSGIFLKNNCPFLNIVKNNLTRRVKLWDDTEVDMKFYYEFENKDILIPRFYPINNDVIEDSCLGKDIEIELKENVEPINERQEKSIDYFLNNYNGVLQLDPGSGKTFCAIYTIAKYKKKAIIFSHKDKLLNQWKHEFLNFTKLEENDIGKLTSKNYKKILNKKIVLCTTQLMASLIKRNVKEFIDLYNKSEFGISFFDEAHVTAGPEAFSLASLFTNTRKVFGLSATPSRNLNNDIIEMHLGKIIKFKAFEGELLKPKINIIKWDYKINKKAQRYINYGGKFCLAKYYNQFPKSDVFNDVVVPIIKKSYESGRTILVVGNIIKHILDVAKRCSFPKEDVGIFIAGADKNDILNYSDINDLELAFKEKRVIFSTWQMARDGNNRKSLDTLICLSPCNNIIQGYGRILRHLDEKKQPIVFDFVDIDPTIRKIWNSDRTEKIQKFEKALEDRIEIYEKMKWEYKIQTLK